MDIWRVTWRDSRGADQSREFPEFLEAWIFVEETLKGKAEVTLVTDRLLTREKSYRSEAAAAQQQEGGRRFVRKK